MATNIGFLTALQMILKPVEGKTVQIHIPDI